VDRLLRILASLFPHALTLTLAGIVAIVVAMTSRWSGATLAHPSALILLGACALVGWTAFHLHVRRAATFNFSRVSDLLRTRRGIVAWLGPLPRALRIVALGLLAVGLARPQTFERREVDVEGIDIMLVLDLSRSMEERDLRPNRLDAAQRTIRSFLAGRDKDRDRIGLVVFGKQAMVQCPLTVDYAALDTIVGDLAIGDIDGMGTAIGDGLGLAVAALRRSPSDTSKVVILLTDGDSNWTDLMTPEDAIASAKDRAVKVFTVLMGRESTGREPLDPFSRQRYGSNPALLQKIAAATDGRYLNAPSTEALDASFKEVRATLEKGKRREVVPQATELFPNLVLSALALILLEVVLALTRFRKFP
jgi:Ca-activated chloride channel homolog